MMATDPRYPIGKFEPKENYSSQEVLSGIERIKGLPDRIEKAILGLSPQQLDTPYREGGWTVRQVVHHVADSHMNAYIRFKWTLTEDTPLIKAYNEKNWAMTPEVGLDPALSVVLLKALHAKLVALLKGLPQEALKKEFIHPETNKPVQIERMIALYAWHGEHHLAHITSLKEKMKW